MQPALRNNPNRLSYKKTISLICLNIALQIRDIWEDIYLNIMGKEHGKYNQTESDFLSGMMELVSFSKYWRNPECECLNHVSTARAQIWQRERERERERDGGGGERGGSIYRELNTTMTLVVCELHETMHQKKRFYCIQAQLH